MIEFDIDLNDILRDLQAHKRNKKEILLSCINDRLNKSLQSYYSEIVDSFNYLRYKDDMVVNKKLNRYDKQCK